MNSNPQEEIEKIEMEAAANNVNAPACTVEKVAAPPDKMEEAANVPACTVEKMAARPDQRLRFFSQYFPLIAVCWLILLIIMGLCIYFATLSHGSDVSEPMAANCNLTNLNDKLRVLENQITDLTAVNQELETRNQELETRNKTRNQELETRNQELETRNQELETRNQELETRNQELETRNQELETRNQELETQNQELETEKDNLTGQIQNISRAQWSIDEYCPKVNNVSERRCQACQKGWRLINESSCYLINDADQKTWEEAREDCRGRSSDLVVVDDRDEQNVLSLYGGYWIGLRAEGGRWKWIDGSDLTESFWIVIPPPPPTDGQCVDSSRFGWTSVSCADRRRWICQKKALSV